MVTQTWHCLPVSNRGESINLRRPLRRWRAEDRNEFLTLWLLEVIWLNAGNCQRVKCAGCRLSTRLPSCLRENRWKASPHRQKAKALCDVQTFAMREAARMTQDKHFHYVAKAGQMRPEQTLGSEERWHSILSESMGHVTTDQWIRPSDWGNTCCYRRHEITAELCESEPRGSTEGWKVHMPEKHFKIYPGLFKIEKCTHSKV